jgi:putative FmdB family regulatory protein
VPFYDYICSICGYEMEVVHALHGHGPAACPRCHGKMRKSISAPAVHFKGTGWARQERRAGPGRVAAKEPKSSSTEGSTPSAEATSSGSSSKDPN